MTITDPFTAPGKNRPTPSPAAVALALQCRKAKAIADVAPTRFAMMPAPLAEASAAGGEVQLVVTPQSLADWKRWTVALGIDGGRMTNTGSSTVCRFEIGGVRGRLIGHGVPALLAAALHAKGGHRG
ncbi:hypothetical protein [Streptomyces sp. NPDC058657]|uniref:hypothetical protein n=1 Tax=unclassified Streptomyces TaxID=2593676 RepID=UPI00364EEB20